MHLPCRRLERVVSELLSPEERGPGEFYAEVGVGPHPLPWPPGEQFDQELLANGDRRNVVDKYRYWTVEAIRADLDGHRSPLHIAIENWQHDLNIGAIVRTANAYNVSAVHIIGKKHWNQRGAMVTDKYLHMRHHPDVETFLSWADEEQIEVIGIDNVPGSRPLETTELPGRCVLLFGQEGPGLSDAAIQGCSRILGIRQYGSTRSMNASAAGAIAMFAWAQQNLCHSADE